MVVNRRQFLQWSSITATASLALLAGCSGAATPADTPAGTKKSADPNSPELTIGLTYVPNVQFAPFYLALQNGYYSDHGANVKLRHHGESEGLFTALEAGNEDLVVVGGDEMMQARDNGVPVVDIATMYTKYPVVVIVKDDSPLSTIEDLRGHSIGVPMPYGETYLGLLAALAVHDMSEKDVDIQIIGFTQQDALASGHVDAVMGFSNNDVPQFNAQGVPVKAIELGDVPLVGIGLGAAEKAIKSSPESLSAIIAATGHAVREIAKDPQLGVDASLKQIPGTVTDEQRALMLKTMTATIPLYGDLTRTWGVNSGPWKKMSAFLAEHDFTKQPVPASEAYTNELIVSE